MTASDHPALAEVLDASLGLGDPATRAHLERCGICRRLASLCEVPRAPGVIDDRFRSEAWIATGGMGSIYRGVDLATGAPVAIKIATSRQPAAIARFEREARLLAQVRHPAIVEYLADGLTADGTRYLAMTWLDGHDLARRLADHGVSLEAATRPHRKTMRASAVEPAGDAAPRPLLAIADAVALGRRVASALQVLHERGIVHRDVKPSNIFLVGGAPSAATLVDFGAAREQLDPHPLTEAGVAIGTAYYMAPEQVRCGEVGAPADCWALGCVLYECLSGHVAFGASQPLAAMTRVLIDEPEPLASLRPDVSPRLAELVHALLDKDAGARPTARAVAELLDVAESFPAGPAPREPAAAAHVVGGERFLRTFLFVRAPGLELPALEQVASHGGHVAPLAPGTGAALITFEPSAAKDEATRAAQFALALRQAAPELVLVLATGDDDSSAATPMPVIVDRAIATLLESPPGEIRLDHTTARLIGDRFLVEDTGTSPRLAGERPLHPAADVLPAASPMVGRHREMTMLISTLDECIEYGVARAVLVTAPAGQGKSRLRHELARTLAARGDDVTVWVGRGEPLSAGVPFVMLAHALRHHAGIGDDEPGDVAQRKMLAAVTAAGVTSAIETAAFVGEIAGVAFPDRDIPALRAARGEPTLIARHTRAALCRFVTALARRRPVLIVLDDLHWGDQPSLAHLDELLRELARSPVMVLALARPEVHDAFPALWQDREVEEIRLRPLPHKAAVELVHHVLGPGVSAARVETLVARSEGNPFFLEELLHATLAGDDSSPGSVLAVVQSRLRGLPDDLRRTLLVASVFGEVFRTDGLAAVSGGAIGHDEVARLHELCRRELIVNEAETGERASYRFRHSLVREAAYSMLREPDAVAAHRRAAEWAVAVGDTDPLVIAGHFMAAGRPAEAIDYFTRAAREALVAGDFAASIQRAERAIAAGARDVALGQLCELQSGAYYWSGRYGEAVRACQQAIDLLPESSDSWYRALGVGIAAAARLDESSAGNALFERVKPTRGSGGERAICLTRAATQLVWQGRLDEADALIATIGELGESELLARAQLAELQSLRHYAVGDLGPSIALQRRAGELFAAAGDANNDLLTRLVLAWELGRIGLAGEAIAAGRRLVGEAAGRGILEALSKLCLACALLSAGQELDEAARLTAAAREYYGRVGSVRFHGWSTTVLAELEIARGDILPAHAGARAAVELLAGHPVVLGHALAVAARAADLAGHADEAFALARRGLAITEQLGGQISGELVPELVAAELTDRRGDRETARAIVARAWARVQARIARFSDPRLATAYAGRVETRRLAALAEAWSLVD